MIRRRHSPDYNFMGDTDTGMTMRWGSGLGKNPEYAPWPELADISISNHCSKGCEYCYRASTPNQSFITLEQYEFILASLQSERWGNVFQVALGGGEPLEHPNFIDIIDQTVQRGIVANFTTNGIYLERSIVKRLQNKVGAVAVSASNAKELSVGKIKLLTEAGIKTNIHFVLDNRSIHDALAILKGSYNDVLQGVNGVIFLTYKPKGRAGLEGCLSCGSQLEEFLALTQKNQCEPRIGFDACFVPLLLKHTDINVEYIDSCECSSFSVYIDENLNVKPCSFANNDLYSYNLNEYTMQVIWEQKYEEYRRNIIKNQCINECKNKIHCRGKCIYFDMITFCYQESNTRTV